MYYSKNTINTFNIIHNISLFYSKKIIHFLFSFQNMSSHCAAFVFVWSERTKLPLKRLTLDKIFSDKFLHLFLSFAAVSETQKINFCFIWFCRGASRHKMNIQSLCSLIHTDNEYSFLNRTNITTLGPSAEFQSAKQEHCLMIKGE